MNYFEYWGLEKSPFDSVPDPGMYFRSHATVENTVAELLFAIEEGNECLAAVVGQVGLGKTMALRVVLDSLDPKKYKIAFLTNPDLTFIQIMREIVGQLTGEKCTTRAKDLLLEEFNEILFKTADEGRKVLVFIDEGNAMRPRNLEKLRLLTNMQEDTRNLLTLIIAGQPKLARMLEHPDRANLFQRIGVYARLEPLASAAVIRDYIEHRLERAGRLKPIFVDGAYDAIYEHSKGIPRLINRVCKLALKAGETNNFSTIDRETIRDIAARFEHPGQKGAEAQETYRRAPDPETQPTRRATPPTTPEVNEVEKKRAEGESKSRSRIHESPRKPQERVQPASPRLAAQNNGRVNPVKTNGSRPSLNEERQSTGTKPNPREDAKSSPPLNRPVESAPSKEMNRPIPSPRPEPAAQTLKTPTAPNQQTSNGEVGERAQIQRLEEPWKVSRETVDKLKKISDQKDRLRLAGQLAAREISEHPERYREAHTDPVRIWDELRSRIMSLTA